MIPKILIVDDELRLCESLAFLFNANHYAVITACSAQHALTLLNDNTFDLAILDVHLPDKPGTDLMKDLRDKSRETIVIIITGDADVDSAITALKCGAYDYIKKPFEFEELLRTVENALNQKALEREKERINRQLYLSEKKYRDLVDNSPDIIYALDLDGNFTFISDAVERLLGFSVDKLIGRHYSMIVCEEDRDKAQWFFSERRSGDRANNGIELRLKLTQDIWEKNQGPPHLTVELKSMGIYEESDAEGNHQYVGTHGVIRDISERQRLQAQLQNVQRLESLGTLAGGIAHDFNNLLMGIQGRSSLMAMNLKSHQPLLEHLNAIDEHIQSGSNLTRQLLGLARGGKYEAKPININQLIEKSADMFGRTKKEIIIQTAFLDDDLVVQADSRQIEQVLLNLFVNAWQAMPDGGTLYLKTNAIELGETFCKPHETDPGLYAHIMVTDTGIGMEQKTLKRIFDPFFTTKEKTRGTGLGLASAYGIIKNHKGIINAASQFGHGSTFNIYLPLTEESIVVEQPADKRKISNGTETLLLVDDENMILQVGKALLEKLGYHVIPVRSGEEAINVVRCIGNEIDLVILDMVMPGMDGGRTFDGIRGLFPEMPVLLSSGYTINERAEKIIRRGCNGFIQKPFTHSEISQKVRQILDRPKIWIN